MTPGPVKVEVSTGKYVSEIRQVEKLPGLLYTVLYIILGGPDV